MFLFIALQYIVLHCSIVALQPLQVIVFHFSTLNCNAIPYKTLLENCKSIHYIMLPDMIFFVEHFSTVHGPATHFNTAHSIAIYFTTVHFIGLYSLQYIALHCISLRYIQV